MGINTWYVAFVIGFAAGFAVCKLWEQAWCWLKELISQLRNGNNHSPEGC